MEQIETQVSDLRYLTEAPVPLPADRLGHGVGVGGAFNNAPHNQPAALPARSNASTGSPRSATPGDNSALSHAISRTPDATGRGVLEGAGNSNSNKRKSEDEGVAAKQQRSKRNRYISIACNECKRRKIKCNGETPCQRCGNLNLACLYAPNCCSNSFRDSDEYKGMTDQMSRLQEHVDNLYQNLNSLRSETLRLAPLQEKILPLPSSTLAGSPASSLSSLHRPELAHIKHTSFRGPTSTAFSLDVANNTINTMGYKGMPVGEEYNAASSEDAAANSRSNNDAMSDPLWDYGKDEMIRLSRIHEDELGIMYPVLSVDSVIEHIKSLTARMEISKSQGTPPPRFDDEKTLMLKIVLCCALTLEEHGHSERANRIYDSMEANLNRKFMSGPCDLKTLPVLAAVAGYRFLSNDDLLAWRVIGQVARLCLEWGIHQRTGIMKIESDEERRNALNSFWSAYVLDRRWAFATGLPYVVRDEDIDPELPLPEDSPFLNAMISYSKLCAKVWRQVAHFGPILAREHRQQDMEQLDKEILQWYERIPEEVKLRHWDKEKQMTSTPSYNLQRLRVWTYLRLNQIRTWLYTPILYSATSIMDNLPQAQRVVDLAKDTIRYLSHLNNTTNLYRRFQVFYHQFLTSSIAVLFLASVHAPVRFSSPCREEFYMGLELVKDLSAKSWVSQRLWRTIGALKEVGPRVGLKQHLDDDAHSTAAITMAGLATGRLSASSPVTGTISPYGRPSMASTPTTLPQNTPRIDGMQAPSNGVRLQNEMSRIFEGYVGINGTTTGPNYGGATGGSLQTPNMASIQGNALATSDTTVFQHFKDLF